MNQHVTPKNGGWQVKGAGNRRATKKFNTQKEAIDFGRKISQNKKSELFIHKRNGEIRERNSYGNDPYPPIG